MGSTRVCNSVEVDRKCTTAHKKHAHRLARQDVLSARASSLTAVRDRPPSTKKARNISRMLFRVPIWLSSRNQFVDVSPVLVGKESLCDTLLCPLQQRHS